MAVHTLVPRLYYYTFGPHEPALRVRSGDTVTAETRDCLGLDSKGNPIPDSMLPIASDVRYRPSNPVVGPIYVEDARVGDLLAVRIQEIRLNGTHGMSKQSENFGSLSGEWMGHTLLYSPPIKARLFEWKIDPVSRIGSLEKNAQADLIFVDYRPFTPLTPENLPWHILFGFHESMVTATMVACRGVSCSSANSPKKSPGPKRSLR